jgi:VIT1/CCC1 family predicted Fe2+/Mn2+ transporter
MSMRTSCAVLIISLSAAAPAFAGTSSAVPAPSSLVLFALGVAGVIIGRRGGHSRRD